MRRYEAVEGESAVLQDRLTDRFYGIVTVADDAGRTCGNNAIARGGILEIRKCYVGGPATVWNRARCTAPSKILNYRIDFATPA